MSAPVENGVVVLSPLDIVHVVAKRKWSVMLFFLAFLFAGAVYVFILANESYTALGRLVIETPPGVYLQMHSSPYPAKIDERTVYTHAESLNSGDLLGKVQTRLVEEGLLEDGAQGPGEPNAAEADSFSDVIEDRLGVDVSEDSHVIIVTFEDTERERAQRTLEILFEEYIRVESERKDAANKAAGKQFEQRLGALKTALEEINERITEEAMKSDLYKAGDSTLLSKSIESMSQELNEVEEEITRLSARIDVASQALKRGNWADVSRTVQTPAMLKFLAAEADIKIEADLTGSGPRSELYPSNTAKNAKLAALGKLMKEELGNEINVLKETRNHLIEEKGRLEQRLASLNQRSGEEMRGIVLLAQLEQQAESLRDMFGVVLGRLYDTEVLPKPDAWVMDSPKVSMQPTFPKKGVSLVASGFFGLVLGIIWAIFNEGRQRATNAALEFVDADETPVFWTLPKLQSFDEIGGDETANGRASLAARRWQETLRAIGYKLTSTRGQGGGQIIAALSAQAGEGKTLFSVALGRSLAREGYQVLLVDCDLRKPDVINWLGCGFEGSLANSLMEGRRRWREDVSKDVTTGLHYLAPSVATIPPTSVLGGERFRTFLQQTRESYDYVILDTSPLLRVADGVVVMKEVDRGVFVNNEKRATGTETRRALESLGCPLQKIAGVVSMGGKLDSSGKLAYYGY